MLHEARKERQELEMMVSARKGKSTRRQTQAPGAPKLGIKVQRLAEARAIGGSVSRICGNLWLGNQRAPLEKLRAASINLVVHVGTAVAYPDGEFRYLHIGVRDKSTGPGLLPYFESVGDEIHRCRLQGCGVFVHCQMGHSRSPTIVIAYLMQHMGLTLQDAYELVQLRRPVADPNYRFKQDLLAYEARLFGANSLAVEGRRFRFVSQAVPDTSPAATEEARKRKDTARGDH